MNTTSRELQAVSVKLPKDLLSWLKTESTREYRSMSRQVVLLLESARQAQTKVVEPQ